MPYYTHNWEVMNEHTIRELGKHRATSYAASNDCLEFDSDQSIDRAGDNFFNKQ